MGIGNYLISLVIVLVMGAFYLVSLYNRVIRLSNIIPENRSNIEVLRKKKEYLITRMVAIIDSYGLHEKGITEKVSLDFGRGESSRGQPMVDRLAYLRMAFPELKADSLYNQLLSELAEVETDIASRREDFNTSVRAYNTVVTLFPANIILRPFGFKPKPFLTVEDINA
ncbi:LemA family protein [Pseudomonas fluorescens]|uniref:Protein LemA n=1 Tax=Pseudomonas fluorescens TaxID=294 RepID=A0A5E6ZW94_PSEFL|nr:LemA family protein [Pseudomonas fluorescens]VVN70820.1 Protein LemA [Pseudomonas fluorescens]